MSSQQQAIPPVCSIDGLPCPLLGIRRGRSAPGEMCNRSCAQHISKPCHECHHEEHTEPCRIQIIAWKDGERVADVPCGCATSFPFNVLVSAEVHHYNDTSETGGCIHPNHPKTCRYPIGALSP